MDLLTRLNPITLVRRSLAARFGLIMALLFSVAWAGGLVLWDALNKAQYRALAAAGHGDAVGVAMQTDAQALPLLAAVAWLAAALAGVCAVVIVRQITGPLGQLTDFAQQASVKRLGLRVDVRTGDELEDLARALNRMMHRLDGSMKRIQRLAFVDATTELPNRERFRQEAEEIAKAVQQGQGEVAAVLVIDLDRFQRFYETVGQGTGEELLAAAAERLSAAVRAADRIIRPASSATRPTLIARWAGSEFALLAPDILRATDAGRLAQLVAASLRQPFEVGGHRIVLGASVGIGLAPQDGATGDDVIRAAEVALAQARAAGGSRAMYFTKAMNQKALQRLALENEIRTGLETGQFVAFFQPKIDLATGKLCGAEALARWQHPTKGLISPAAFITAAEETGLINPLGEAVLRDACRRAAAWMRRGLEVRVAVNVSPTQFANDRFADMVLDVLALSGFHPRLLELEITESVAMSDPERVLRLIGPLRRRGVRFAIDDFGTGHSNLAALARIPFDVFKIDQSFVRGLGEGDPQAQTLIDTILAMARSLQFETVAEGVETAEQAGILSRGGCTMAQGYLFGAPMSQEKFEELARAWSADQPAMAAAGL